jgi:ABC-type multidrug transport system fused ATPase/permease subunit
MSFVVLGFVATICAGFVWPIIGVLIMEAEFALAIPLAITEPREDTMKHNVNKWVAWFFVAAASNGVLSFIGKFLYAYVGENITLGLRRDFYRSLMRKHIGWHDDRDH